MFHRRWESKPNRACFESPAPIRPPNADWLTAGSLTGWWSGSSPPRPCTFPGAPWGGGRPWWPQRTLPRRCTPWGSSPRSASARSYTSKLPGAYGTPAAWEGDGERRRETETERGEWQKGKQNIKTRNAWIALSVICSFCHVEQGMYRYWLGKRGAQIDLENLPVIAHPSIK